jgi:hypothetical protein
MKLPFGLMKIIGFVIVCSLLGNVIKYYIFLSRYSSYSIICGVGFQMILIYFIYKGFVE